MLEQLLLGVGDAMFMENKRNPWAKTLAEVWEDLVDVDDVEDKTVPEGSRRSNAAGVQGASQRSYDLSQLVSALR